MSSSEVAKESGHWYDKDGKPAYTYLNAKGEEKNTTLRQARKGNLFPSVTTIMKIKAAPGLEIWKRNQTLHSAATLPTIAGESADDWCKRVIIDAGEHGKQAREKGTAIHGAIERHFLGLEHDHKKEVELVVNKLKEMGITYVASEKSFSSPLGYGGKVDFEGIDTAKRDVVIDFKSTEFKGKKKKHWPEQILQLSAYGKGRKKKNPRLINLFISRNLEEPQIDVHEWDEEEIDSGWKQFQLIVELWQLEKNYKPVSV